MQFYAETSRRKGEARLQGYGNRCEIVSATIVGHIDRSLQMFGIGIANLCPSGGYCQWLRDSFFYTLAFHLLLTSQLVIFIAKHFSFFNFL